MQIHRLHLAFLCVSLASALPSLWPREFGPFSQTEAKVSGYVSTGRKLVEGTTGECDLSKASLPQPPVALPPPSAGLQLSHIAIGRGTQNYTCDLSNSTAVPLAIGAVASLFNVSCLAVNSAGLVSALPQIAINLPVPFSSSSNNNANFDLSGHHYFLNGTTPFFNMDTSQHNYGTGAFKKANSSNAPADAMKGADNAGNGAVPWLKLGALDTAGQVFQEVYRINTAGGQPPKSCQGQESTFEIDYAAEYWLYT